MFNIDYPSFLIGASITALCFILYKVYKPCFVKPSSPVKTNIKRLAGSRKEDAGVYVDRRVERKIYFDGKFRYRKGEQDGSS